MHGVMINRDGTACPLYGGFCLLATYLPNEAKNQHYDLTILDKCCSDVSYSVSVSHELCQYQYNHSNLQQFNEDKQAQS